MRYLPLALLCVATLPLHAWAIDFEVELLAPPAEVSGNVTLRAHPQGGFALAYLSVVTGQIVYGEGSGADWQFQVVAAGVSATTEIALAFDGDGRPNIAYALDGLQLARRLEEGWKSIELAPLEGASFLDLEFSQQGDLHLAYSDGLTLRYLRREAGGATSHDVVAQTDFGPRSIDLELDSTGIPHLVYWAGFTGNTTDQTWGRSVYTRLDDEDWPLIEVQRWAAAPALALGPADIPYVTCHRYNQGQRVHAFDGSGFYGSFVDDDFVNNQSVLGASIQVGDDGIIHIAYRSRYWRGGVPIGNQASIPQAGTMGREALVVDSDGNLFAAYRNVSSLRFAQLLMENVPPPVIVEFGGPDWIYENLYATLHWELENAAGFLLEPEDLALNYPPYNETTVRPDATTEYTLTAYGLSGSVSATHVVEVRPHEPVIDAFIAVPPQAVATQEVSLRWQTNWATTIRIEPIGHQAPASQNGKLVYPTETTTYTLIASSQHGSASAELTVEVIAPFELRSFTASHGIVGRADPVQLEWEVFGLVDVEIEDIGPVDDAGSLFVVPGETRDYTLTARYEDIVETATVHVEVNDDFLQSRFYLSWSPDEVVLEPPDLAVYQNFVVYVLGVSLDGGAIAGVEFGVDFPPGLMLLGSDLYSDRAINVLMPPDFVVGLGRCYVLDPVHRLASLNFMAMNQATIDEGDIHLRPAAIASLEGRVAYATCGFDLNGSEIEGPLSQALQGPPLYLSPERVPVLQLGLRAQWVDGRVQLRWNELPLDQLDELRIGRSLDGERWDEVARMTREELLGRQEWEDRNPPIGEQLHYVLRALAGDLLLVEERAQLKTDRIPPTRTRFVDAYPNPFNPSTTLRFLAAERGLYELRVLNAAGRTLRTLNVFADQPGLIERGWDGRDESGQLAASGVYYVQLVGADALDQLRIVLLK